jgi:hypothetical protein
MGDNRRNHRYPHGLFTWIFNRILGDAVTLVRDLKRLTMASPLLNFRQLFPDHRIRAWNDGVCFVKNPGDRLNFCCLSHEATFKGSEYAAVVTTDGTITQYKTHDLREAVDWYRNQISPDTKKPL